MAINPRITPKRKNRLDINKLTKGILDGNTTDLSTAITLIESAKPEIVAKGQEIVNQCISHSGKSIRIGLTGVPGVGKSTFTEAFGNYLITEYHKKVAVLAIDPSSKKSGGSILGDKTRMITLSGNKNAFIRPSPSAGTLGGVARATRESILLCEAAGFDVVIVETVGVGQSETEVREMTDFFLLLMLAGAGDELQGIKRGIMEMADAIAINKADGDNLAKAKMAKKEYQSALHLFPNTLSGWVPKVEICSALTGMNIDRIWQLITDYEQLTKNNGYFEENRRQQLKYWFEQSVQNALNDYIKTNTDLQMVIKKLKQEVVLNKLTPYSAARKVLSVLLKKEF